VYLQCHWNTVKPQQQMYDVLSLGLQITKNIHSYAENNHYTNHIL